MKKKISETKTSGSLEYDISRAFLGIFVFIYGLMFLIDNLNVYPMNIDLSNIWPLLIVFIGLSFFEKKNVVSTVVGSVATIMCATLFFSSFSLNYIDNSSFSIENNPTLLAVQKGIETKRAEVELNISGGKVNVYGVDSKGLVEGRLVVGEMEKSVNQLNNSSTQKVVINLRGSDEWIKGGDVVRDQFNLGLNKNVPIDLTVNSGQSDNIIDLSGVMAEKIRVLAGASDVSLKLGNSVNSDISIQAGLSSVKLRFPTDVGVRINLESGFSSQELPGFSLVEDNIYQSKGYESKKKKINVEAVLGMTNLNVEWYPSTEKQEISLFYYNKVKDENKSCNVDFILPVKRCVTKSNDQIKDTINLLIAGELTEEEKKDGFVTEFPNKEFKLLETNLDNEGTLTLKFTEVPGFTTGGVCRVKILGSEIIRTAKQFPSVKKVVLEPETLFEP